MAEKNALAQFEVCKPKAKRAKNAELPHSTEDISFTEALDQRDAKRKRDIDLQAEHQTKKHRAWGFDDSEGEEVYEQYRASDEEPTEGEAEQSSEGDAQRRSPSPAHRRMRLYAKSNP